ncbi:PASTA domain-containing protein [Candidatus Fermentibacteria bacterium]|nr:PASTA domain-containing protein [Candidatus Fermentibacteria bacterium]
MKAAIRYFMWYVVLTAIMVLGGLAAMDKTVMPLLVLHGRERPIPDVTGFEYPSAADSLRAAGFRPVIGGHEPDPVLPLGFVVRQEPLSGASAKPSRTVHLFLASGPARVAVPALARMGCREALVVLSQAGLRTGDIIMVQAGWGSVGQVLASHPAEGQSVLVDDEVHLLVAGPHAAECYIVPHLVGRPISEVVQRLRGDGIPLGRRTYVPDSGAPEGTVFATTPPAGFRICRGESLSVVLAS